MCFRGCQGGKNVFFFFFSTNFLGNFANQFEVGEVPNLNARFYGFKWVMWFLVGPSFS